MRVSRCRAGGLQEGGGESTWFCTTMTVWLGVDGTQATWAKIQTKNWILTDAMRRFAASKVVRS